MNGVPDNSVFLGIPGWAKSYTLVPRIGDQSIAFTAIPLSLPVEDDLDPSNGANNLWIWIDGPTVIPFPVRGDTVLAGSATYEIFDVAVDVSGAQGATLRMKKIR